MVYFLLERREYHVVIALVGRVPPLALLPVARAKGQQLPFPCLVCDVKPHRHLCT